MSNLKSWLLFVILLLGTAYNLQYCNAGQLRNPPVVPDQTIEQINFNNDIHSNWQNLEIVTSTPNGSRTGRRGDILLLNNSGTYYLEVCVSSPTGTVWHGIVLSQTP